MNSLVLAFVVIGQIAVFQFAAVTFVRSVFAAILGDPPDPLAREISTYLRSASRYRFVLGGVLLLFTLASAIGLPPESVVRKLLLAAVSLTSSGAFAYASVTDRRTVRMFREALPDFGVRRASLRPRASAHWYGVAWEVLPVVILAATLVATITLAPQLGHIPTEMYVLQILQVAVVIGTLLYTFRHSMAVPNVSSRLAMLRDRPELALDFGERLAAREMRYFMAAKIGVALLLGVSVVKAGLDELGHAAAPLLGTANWVIIGLLLASFATFVFQVGALTRRMQHQAQQGGNKTDRSR